MEVKSPVEYSDAKWAQVDYDIPAMHYVNGEKHWNFIRKRACSFGWSAFITSNRFTYHLFIWMNM